ncbi:MAG TPA: quinone oxidoreductase [Candidatus Binataceae bacterium]|jgi:NADPH2:quinone reductase|nr:quinone oxidoreductase [Candidatus Binataceae bacterium]
MKSKAIVVKQTGGPEVLQLGEVEVPAPGPGEALVRHRAIGLNFVEIYFRSGVYPAPSMPFTPGSEAAGIVEAVGAEVTEVKPGDRVAYAGGPMGAYCEARVMPARVLVKLPDTIDEVTAAAAMLKGMTAHALIFSVYAIKPGETILVQAAAGGVGLILCQWAKARGATVIGTVGSDEKARVAAAHGCDHTVVYSREDFPARVKELTGGAMVPVVYDSVGQATFMKSLDCLQPRGMMVTFGQASGMVAPFSVNILSAKGSLYLTRPTLQTYTAKREDLVARAQALFEVLAKGTVKCAVQQRFELRDAAAAHRALGERNTSGSSVLIP